MIARRSAGFTIAAAAVLTLVSLLASYGALWWTGSVLLGAAIGTLCGLAAAFTANAVGVALRRGGVANERSDGDRITEQTKQYKQQGEES